jgi:predicted transcriptional regulator
MDVLWRADSAMRVRDVLERLDSPHPHAYTTVMTVLDNLHAKAWVTRDRAGRAYEYRPSASRAEAEARALRAILDGSDQFESALLHFAASMNERETAALRKALRRRGSASRPSRG